MDWNQKIRERTMIPAFFLAFMSHPSLALPSSWIYSLLGALRSMMLTATATTTPQRRSQVIRAASNFV